MVVDVAAAWFFCVAGVFGFSLGLVLLLVTVAVPFHLLNAGTDEAIEFVLTAIRFVVFVAVEFIGTIVVVATLFGFTVADVVVMLGKSSSEACGKVLKGGTVLLLGLKLSAV